jgi:hypothetical protein
MVLVFAFHTTLEIANKPNQDNLALRDYTFAACVTLRITNLATARRRNPETRTTFRLKFFHHHQKIQIWLNKELIRRYSPLATVLFSINPLIVMVEEAMDYA